MRRSAEERVDEFMQSNPETQILYDDSEEIVEMFGAAAEFCNTSRIINTAFYLGYLSALKEKKH